MRVHFTCVNDVGSSVSKPRRRVKFKEGNAKTSTRVIATRAMFSGVTKGLKVLEFNDVVALEFVNNSFAEDGQQVEARSHQQSPGSIKMCLIPIPRTRSSC